MKKNKKILTTIGLVGACTGVGVITYMYMQKKKECIKEYMAYLQQ